MHFIYNDLDLYYISSLHKNTCSLFRILSSLWSTNRSAHQSTLKPMRFTQEKLTFFMAGNHSRPKAGQAIEGMYVLYKTHHSSKVLKLWRFVDSQLQDLSRPQTFPSDPAQLRCWASMRAVTAPQMSSSQDFSEFTDDSFRISLSKGG